MEFILTLVAGTGLAFWGAYELGKRSSIAAASLAIVLLPVSWLLFQVDNHSGEGAAAGVGIVWLGAWLIGGACTLLAGTMLFASWRIRDSALAKTLLIFAVLPFVVLLLSRGLSSPHNSAHPSDNARGVPVERLSTKLEGHIWALDNNVVSESECRSSTAEFEVGCKTAVARNVARQGK